MSLAPIKEILKQKAFEVGFDAFGVAEAKELNGHKDIFDQWIKKGYHGSMHYMGRNREKRLDPGKLFAGARSVIVLAMNYHSQDISPAIGISKYAFGQDYHHVIKSKLSLLITLIEKLVPGSRSRGFTDSAPILERAWAVEAGLGWTGKNACLIIPKRGSFFFLAEIITTAELPSDTPYENNLCGNCVRCMEACPTNAILSPGNIDARKCISYLTIESKEPVTHEIKTRCQGWVFGCDTCQDVCPHNRFAEQNLEEAFRPLPELMSWTAPKWKSMEKQEFKKIFVERKSPVSRISYEKFISNF